MSQFLQLLPNPGDETSTSITTSDDHDDRGGHRVMRGGLLPVRLRLLVLVRLLRVGGARASFLQPLVVVGPDRHHRHGEHPSFLLAHAPPPNRGGGAGRGATPPAVVEWKVQDSVALLEGHCYGGVTALLLLGEASSEDREGASDPIGPCWLVAGTKRGRIFRRLRKGLVGDRCRLPFAQELVVQEYPSPTPSSSPVSPSGSNKLPIYGFATTRALASSARSIPGGVVLLAGGADRYVSVLRLPSDADEPAGKDVHGDRVLYVPCVQKLGPHTGWVKDVALVVEGVGAATAAERTGGGQIYGAPRASSSTLSSVATLYSIGCNGIEIWESEVGGDGDADDEKGDGAPWKHRGKWSVDSSPLGCTLSSDVLCLAAHGTGKKGRLWAGGVDGRIHGWRTAPTNGRSRPTTRPSDDDNNKCAAWLAHQGRVTQLLVHQNRFLFSSSHDGTIKCWAVGSELPATSAESSDAAEKRPISTLDIGDDKRITGTSMVPLVLPAAATTNATVWLAFGTQNGSIGLTRLTLTDTNADHVDERHYNWSLLGHLQLPNEPSVHCLSRLVGARRRPRQWPHISVL